jgi:ATP-dependent Clp protease ATP-binding subunit ClpB
MSRRSLNQFMILTSNLGSQFLIDPELDETRKRESVLAMVRSSFKPEFLNRLDDVVIFDALTKDEHGYDPVYGARPLRRLMQKEIDDRLANLLLAGEAIDGSFVKVDVDSGGGSLAVGVEKE